MGTLTGDELTSLRKAASALRAKTLAEVSAGRLTLLSLIETAREDERLKRLKTISVLQRTGIPKKEAVALMAQLQAKAKSVTPPDCIGWFTHAQSPRRLEALIDLTGESDAWPGFPWASR
jgi:hypothetical protein